MKRKIISIAIGAAVIIAIYGTFFALGITCPIKFLTGISCPGCGMSRAWMSALTLRFNDAFSYHPLWFFVPLVGAALLILYLKRKMGGFNVVLYVFIGAMIVVYIIRMFATSDIVVFAPLESAPVRLVVFLYEKITGLFNG